MHLYQFIENPENNENSHKTMVRHSCEHRQDREIVVSMALLISKVHYLCMFEPDAFGQQGQISYNSSEAIVRDHVRGVYV